jgi:serine/threonine protein kinase
LNPANVFVTQLELKLLDFGLAAPINAAFPNRTEELTLAFAGSSASGSGVVFCTHLSPEQAAGVAVDSRGDLFSLGTVIYEMATGVPAFSSSNANHSAERLLQRTPAAPRSVNPDIPAALENIIVKAIEKDREQRYRSASQMVQELQALLDVKRLVGLQQFAVAEHLLLGQLAANPHNTEAEKTVRDVQEHLNRQRKSEYIRQLCSQAEEAEISKRYAEAIEIYMRAIKVDPSAHILRRRINQSQGDPERAQTMQEIRAKIDRLRGLTKEADLPPWIDPEASLVARDTSEKTDLSPTFNAGYTLQKYKIIRLLGRRATSDLYEAEDIELRRRVAIEYLPAVDDRKALEAIRSQCASVCGLTHPNLCTVYEVGEHNGHLYVVMEYLEGGNSLENILRFPEMLPLRTLLEMIRQVCVALAYAHQNGLTHLGIRPSNVISQRGRSVKLASYWLASTDNQAGLIGAGDPTELNYRSPEQLRGEVSDGRSDIFSVGVLLFQSLTGQPPFTGSEHYLVHQILNDACSPLGEFVKSCPPELDGILARSLAKNPDERYQTAEAMAADLSQIVDDLKPDAKSTAKENALLDTIVAEGRFGRETGGVAKDQTEPKDKGQAAATGSFTQLLRTLSSEVANSPAAEPSGLKPEAPLPSSGESLFTQTYQPSAANLPASPSEVTRIIDASRVRETQRHGTSAPARAQPPQLGLTMQMPQYAPAASMPPTLAPSLPAPPGPAPSSELLDRTLDLALAASVPVLTPVEVLALLRLPSSTSLSELLQREREAGAKDVDFDPAKDVRSRDFPLEFWRDSGGRLKPVDVIMRVIAPDFDPPRMEKKVRVQPDRNCERQTFLLTPKQTGVLSVQFDLLIDDLTVASRVLRTQSETSDRVQAPSNPIVVSVPLSVVSRSRRRLPWLYAAAAVGLIAAAIPFFLHHPSTTAAPSAVAGRGFETELVQSSSVSALPGKNYALLFATDNYQYWPHLNNPLNDANTIAGELRDNYSFSDTAPEVVANPRTKDIIDTLHEYATKSYGPNDQLFIYFAGHGFFDEREKEGFLVGADSRLQKDDTDHSSYVDFSRLSTILDSIPVQHIFVVLDVCYGGAFDAKVTKWAGQRGDEYADVAPEKFIQRKLAVKGRLYLTSGQITTVPDGKAGQHSPFARRFIESLRSYGGKKQLVTATSLAVDVAKLEPEPRFGEFGDSAPGADFLFIPK